MLKSKVVYLALLGLLSAPLWAQQVDFAEMSLEELMQVPIEVATGVAKPISEAPAVVTVITADDILAMGATSLDEILEAVPGFHVPTAYDYGPESSWIVRGVRTQVNSHVLLLLNGQPLTDPQNAGPISLAMHMPVAGIARVEVIRGPGSAVYGADAFTGLINVITKDTQDIDGTQLGVRTGSFDFQNAWLQYGGSAGNWDISLSVEWQTADGDDEREIISDAQGLFDMIFQTNASLAPGSIDTRFDISTAHLGLKNNNWNIRLWGYDNNDHGNMAGVASALDHTGYTENQTFLGDVIYETSDLAKDWTLSSRLGFLQKEGSALLHIFPADVVLPIGAGGSIDFTALASYPPTYFSDGFIGNPGTEAKTISFDTFGLYTGAERHRVRLGLGYSTRELDVFDRANYGPGVLDVSTVGTPPPGFVDGTLTDKTGTSFAFLPNLDRDHWYVSVQDEWAFSEDWEATLGVRYDDYSDVGGTINPRIALVWSGAENLITKLLFATAYRAPAFGELEKVNNPTALGNPSLDPEEIQTTELVFDYQPSSRFRTVLNLFHSDIEGLIGIVPDLPPSTLARYQNANNQESKGFELEFFWDISSKFRLRGWYAWQETEDKATGLAVPWVPKDHAFLHANWRPFGSWYFGAKVKWTNEINRPTTDPRAPVDGYTRVDLTIGAKEIAEHWGLAVSVRNLFDKDAFDAAFNQFIENDYPIEGRRILAEVRLNF